MKRLDNVDPINERREARAEQSEREKLMTFDQVKLMFFKPDEGAKAQHRPASGSDRQARNTDTRQDVRHDIDTPHITKILDKIGYTTPSGHCTSGTRPRSKADKARRPAV
jgi:hypothetical protein